MTLSFVGKASRLVGAASCASLSFLLLLGCATGDLSVASDEPDGDVTPSPDAGSSPAERDGSPAGDDGAAPDDATLSDAALVEAASIDGGAVDASIGPPIRCGSGSLLCSGATPSCCEIAGDGGSTFGCVASHGACSDYWIQCASAADCAAGSVCCHYKASMKCETSCSTNAILVCDPKADAGCPPGKACSVTALNGGQPSPYFLCSP